MAKNLVFAEALPIKSYLKEAIYRINVGLDLTEEIAYLAFRDVLFLKKPEERGIFMGILLNGVMAKRPTVEEVRGFIRAAFSVDGFDPLNLNKIQVKGKKVIGIAGSGKKGIKTMNVSSCAAIVASSLGACIAKPCSNSTSSVTGSSDFVKAVGVNINVNNKKMISVLKKTCLGFFKIENLLPKFDSLYGSRFYAPHVLSFGLAAMTLPFRPDCLLYGLAHPNVELSIKVLQKFGYQDAMVATTTDNGIHFLDEFGIFGATTMIGIRNGVVGKLVNLQIAEILKLPSYNRESIKSTNNKEDNIRLAVNVLSGKGEKAREDIVSVNAGTLLYLADKAVNLEEGYCQAKRAIKLGKPIKKLIEFIEATSGDTKLLERYL